MKRKMVLLIIGMLLSVSILVFVNNDVDVIANPGGDGNRESESEDIGLDYDYIWDLLNDFINVVHYDKIWGYGDEVIRKGRTFGTAGDNFTAYYINETLDEMGLDNVQEIPLETLNPKLTDPILLPFKWNCNLKIETIDFNLTVNNEDWNFTDDGHIPKNETFTMPCAAINNQLVNPDYGSMSYNNSYTNIKLVPKDFEESWWLDGATSQDYLNVSASDLEILTVFSTVCGNATYIPCDQSVPEDQDGRVFLFDEVEDNCEDQLDNITNATGVILIHNTSTRYATSYNFSNFTSQVVKIDDDVTNLTMVLEMLQNGTNMVVDNLDDNEIFTFMHNFSHLDCWWPVDDFLIVGEYNPGKGKMFTKASYVRLLNPFRPFRGWCYGFIAYYQEDIDDDIHPMESTKYLWRGGGSNLSTQQESWLTVQPYIQIFTVNRRMGEFLYGNASTTTISGYFEQKESYVDAYNVVGNLTTKQNPDDNITILSARFDAWWGECPGDSGAGNAILLGIAKYFMDYNITPKCNLSFLFTTGEEYLMRGSWHYSLTHPENEYNIIRWIGLDQLGFTQPEEHLFFYDADCKNENDMPIIEAIDNLSNFEIKTGLDFNAKPTEPGYANTDDTPWICRSNCDTIVILKYNPTGVDLNWKRHHTTGKNYTEGDSMKFINQSEVNDVFNLTWDVVKYYTVDPDCWNDAGFTFGVTNTDDDYLFDTIKSSTSIKSILPHDYAMVNATLVRADDLDTPIFTEFLNMSLNRTTKTMTINCTLPAGKSPGLYRLRVKLYNSTGKINEIVGIGDENSNITQLSPPFYLHPYNYGSTPPEITNINDDPDPVGYGQNIVINADVVPIVGSLQNVGVNITYPDDTVTQFDMSNTEGDTYEYIFNDTWQHGQYYYNIWAIDSNNNTNGSQTQYFNVSAQADISICTIKDEYDDNQWINITDPPIPQIGYELLDDGEVLRIWNKYDSYYFDTNSGIQLTNHYNEYWSHNVLMLGYYNSNVWNLIFRTDELSGFNKNIESDGMSFVNATLWKDLSYQGYDFRLAIRYYLGVDDNELTVIPYIKNIGDENIPYDLGFAWELKDIQIDMTPSGDYIEINGESYYLNQEDLDETYTNLVVPCFYIREDITSTCSESLYLCWDENLNYIVNVKSRTGQYNAPVTLGIKIGTLNVGQEKYTELYWHDVSEVVYYFDQYMIMGEEWTTTPAFMVDGNTSNFAQTSLNSDVELCLNNACTGSDLGTISKVEIRTFGKYSGLNQRNILLRPVFNGVLDGDNHVFVTPPVADWSSWFDITTDTNAPDWVWTHIRDLDCDVQAGSGMGSFTLYCSKVEIRVTYNMNYPPGITAQYPLDGATGTGIAPVLTVSVYDPEGDSMDITWLSNSSGSWQVFGTNNSVGNGTYHQVFTNANVNGQWWYWKVNITDGTNYIESDVYKLYTGYESKIVNIGSTSFKGYLLMQIQYYNNSSSSWVVALDTVNETSPRTMLWGDPAGDPGQNVFALDSVFNGLVNTSNLSGFGNGTYRVYVAFRDPSGNVLKANSNSYIEAIYEFTVTFN